MKKAHNAVNTAESANTTDNAGKTDAPVQAVAKSIHRSLKDRRARSGRRLGKRAQ